MAKVIITVWLIQDNERVMREIILPEFKKNHPEVEVLLTTTTWEYLWDKVVRYYKRNQGPDVFQIGNTLNGLLAEMGAIKEITALADKIGGLGSFIKEAGRLAVAPGTDHVYSIPWLWNFGGDFLSADNKSVKFNSDQSLQGLKAYFNLIKEYCHHESSPL